MKPHSFEYIRPRSIEETVDCLARYGEDVLGGQRGAIKRHLASVQRGKERRPVDRPQRGDLIGRHRDARDIGRAARGQRKEIRAARQDASSP